MIIIINNNNNYYNSSNSNKGKKKKKLRKRACAVSHLCPSIHPSPISLSLSLCLSVCLSVSLSLSLCLCVLRQRANEQGDGWLQERNGRARQCNTSLGSSGRRKGVGGREGGREGRKEGKAQVKRAWTTRTMGKERRKGSEDQ